MSLKFVKMHSLGNDFMVIDASHQLLSISAAQIQQWADRRTGIGFDQCLIIKISPDHPSEYHYRIINANGQEVGQCGNGARCIALFLLQHGLIKHNQPVVLHTITTQITVQISSADHIRVTFPPPRLDPQDIPLTMPKISTQYSIPLSPNINQLVHAVNVGNPHAIALVTDIQHVNVAQLGQAIAEHVLFPQQINVGFMQIDSHDFIRLRVYERGCGETNACGSGAVAAVVIGRLFYALKQKVVVQLPGGCLQVDWQGEMDQPIDLFGPAVWVYEGSI